MARLNKKSTKAAIVNLLKRNNENIGGDTERVVIRTHYYLLLLAKELELDIKPEDYK